MNGEFNKTRFKLFQEYLLNNSTAFSNLIPTFETITLLLKNKQGDRLYKNIYNNRLIAIMTPVDHNSNDISKKSPLYQAITNGLALLTEKQHASLKEASIIICVKENNYWNSFLISIQDIRANQLQNIHGIHQEFKNISNVIPPQHLPFDQLSDYSFRQGSKNTDDRKSYNHKFNLVKQMINNPNKPSNSQIHARVIYEALVEEGLRSELTLKRENIIIECMKTLLDRLQDMQQRNSLNDNQNNNNNNTIPTNSVMDEMLIKTTVDGLLALTNTLNIIQILANELIGQLSGMIKTANIYQISSHLENSNEEKDEEKEPKKNESVVQHDTAKNAIAAALKQPFSKKKTEANGILSLMLVKKKSYLVNQHDQHYQHQRLPNNNSLTETGYQILHHIPMLLSYAVNQQPPHPLPDSTLYTINQKFCQNKNKTITQPQKKQEDITEKTNRDKSKKIPYLSIFVSISIVVALSQILYSASLLFNFPPSLTSLVLLLGGLSLSLFLVSFRFKSNVLKVTTTGIVAISSIAAFIPLIHQDYIYMMDPMVTEILLIMTILSIISVLLILTINYLNEKETSNDSSVQMTTFNQSNTSIPLQSQTLQANTVINHQQQLQNTHPTPPKSPTFFPPRLVNNHSHVLNLYSQPNNQGIKFNKSDNDTSNETATNSSDGYGSSLIGNGIQHPQIIDNSMQNTHVMGNGIQHPQIMGNGTTHSAH